jgi:WS/DGAT/MGAT family acyltransferase
MHVERLSPLDASFLAVETPVAHMHVGWAARLEPVPGTPRPRFPELFAHVVARLERAPRTRRRLAPVPLGVHDPEWVEDPTFDPWEHILHSPATDLSELADAVMSAPLPRDRPLWQLWIADRLGDGTIGVVGKAHHCMVDGIAAVELGTMLLDMEPEPGPMAGDRWRPRPTPGRVELLVRAATERLAQQARLANVPLQLLRSPTRVLELPGLAAEMARTLSRSVFPLAQPSALNAPNSPLRHLAPLRRPLDDLRLIKERTGTTINDVVLAACAGGLCGYLAERGNETASLKAMVPVNVRDEGAEGDLGNRISFMFVELPCGEPDPLRRLADVHESTALRKAHGDPQGTDSALQALAYAPGPVQKVVSHLVSSPRTFNLVVSNIPGPRIPMYLRGCELQEAYPVVPLAQDHGLSIGMTTVKDDACFGFYADRKMLPDADALPAHVDTAIEELLAVTAPAPQLVPV